MKFILATILTLLTACTQGAYTSVPMGQLEIYGIQKIKKQELTKELLETICSEVDCQVFLSSKYPNGGRKDIVRVKFENGSSFIFEFHPNETTGFLYVKENIISNDQAPIKFIEGIESKFGPTLFSNVKKWNCYPAKDSCGTEEQHLKTAVSFVEALAEVK